LFCIFKHQKPHDTNSNEIDNIHSFSRSNTKSHQIKISSFLRKTFQIYFLSIYFKVHKNIKHRLIFSELSTLFPQPFHYISKKKIPKSLIETHSNSRLTIQYRAHYLRLLPYLNSSSSNSAKINDITFHSFPHTLTRIQWKCRKKIVSPHWPISHHNALQLLVSLSHMYLIRLLTYFYRFINKYMLRFFFYFSNIEIYFFVFLVMASVAFDQKHLQRNWIDGLKRI
jgi:hypothetical protein